MADFVISLEKHQLLNLFFLLTHLLCIPPIWSSWFKSNNWSKKWPALYFWWGSKITTAPSLHLSFCSRFLFCPLKMWVLFGSCIMKTQAESRTKKDAVSTAIGTWKVLQLKASMAMSSQFISVLLGSVSEPSYLKKLLLSSHVLTSVERSQLAQSFFSIGSKRGKWSKSQPSQAFSYVKKWKGSDKGVVQT